MSYHEPDLSDVYSDMPTEGQITDIANKLDRIIELLELLTKDIPGGNKSE